MAAIVLRPTNHHVPDLRSLKNPIRTTTPSISLQKIRQLLIL